MPTPPPPGAAADLDRRYGRGRPREAWWRRPLPLAGAVLGGAAVLAWMVWVAVAGSAERAEPTVISYRVLDDTRIELHYTVAKDPGTTVRCTLQALDASHAEVGVLQEDLGPDGREQVGRTTVVRTTGRPVTAVVRSCEVVGG